MQFPPYQKPKWYSWDQLSHKVKCWVVPGYKQKRRQATLELIAKLKASRHQIMEYVEAELLKMERRYTALDLVNEPIHGETMRSLEKRIYFHREALAAIKAGRSVYDVDVIRLLKNIFQTTDAATLEKIHETQQSSQSPKPK